MELPLFLDSGDSRKRLWTTNLKQVCSQFNGSLAHGKSKTSSVWDTFKWKGTNVCASNKSPHIRIPYTRHVYTYPDYSDVT